MKSSTKFLKAYNKLVNQKLASHNYEYNGKLHYQKIKELVNEYNNTIGLTKEDCLILLTTTPSLSSQFMGVFKRPFIRLDDLIKIVGSIKFIEFIRAYNWRNKQKILKALPELYIYFMRDCMVKWENEKNPDSAFKRKKSIEIKLILECIYKYEWRQDIRLIILEKLQQINLLQLVSKKDLIMNGLDVKINADLSLKK